MNSRPFTSLFNNHIIVEIIKNLILFAVVAVAAFTIFVCGGKFSSTKLMAKIK